MCGILTTVNLPFDQSALDTIRHRGPDGSGISQAVVGAHLVTLGHRRLSILDLSAAGHQPMWTPDRTHAIVYNGEIYNHTDLRAGLDSIAYRGHSDTETILHCLARRGPGCAAAFNGIFAFCLLDVGAKKMYLVRDTFGIKPLYYRLDQRTLVACSELRGIRRFFDDPLDPESLAELLRLRYLPAPDTLLQNVQKLRPGHIAEIDLNGPMPRVSEYPFPERRPVATTRSARAEAISQYRATLTSAVRRQLQSDVEVGVLLSGGVDSAVVAALAQKAVPYRMKAFTVGYSEADSSDEIADAAESARVVGLDHHHVRIGFENFLELLPSINSMVEEPLATTSIVPMFALSRLASSHVKVVLSGQGADEILGGYRRYQMELLRGWIPMAAVPLARRILGGTRREAIARTLGAIGEPDDVRRFEEVYTVFPADRIAKLIGRAETRAEDRIRYFFDLLHCAARREPVERMMSLDARMNLADDLLLYTDKITMHHSLECRVPLLDLELVRLVESLPRAYRIAAGRGKRIHKWAAEKILPAHIVHRKKKGFQSPASRWFRSGGLLRDILLDPKSRFASAFDLREVERVLREHESGLNRERHIFLLLSLHFWMRECLAPRVPSGCAVAV
jgi:asparagine synthase (glutamine-hydrolysing)